MRFAAAIGLLTLNNA